MFMKYLRSDILQVIMYDNFRKANASYFIGQFQNK